MERLIQHANGQWSLEDLSKAIAPAVKPAGTVNAVTPQRTMPVAAPAPAAPATPAQTAAPTGTPATKPQVDLGRYWERPKADESKAPTIDYSKLNQAKVQKPNSIDYAKVNAMPKPDETGAPTINYATLEKPKPQIENVAALKAKLMEDRNKAGKGVPPPRKAVQEMQVRQKVFNKDMADHAIKPKK